MTRPLAEVTGPFITIDGTHWELVGQRGAAEDLSRLLNARHIAGVEPLLALLSQAREWLSEHVDGNMGELHYVGCGANHGQPCSCRFPAALELWARLDAANPGEWVPAEKYRALELVLRDALEERRSPYEERCARALARIGERDWYATNGTGTHLMEPRAILEGREPEPAKTAAGRLAHLAEMARVGFLGPDLAEPDDDNPPRGRR